MIIDPGIGESITLGGKVYTFTETPNAPGIIYAEIGRKAKVYRVINNGQAYALKAFKPKYRSLDTVENIQRIAAFQDVPGLSVAQRLVITPEAYPEVVGRNEALTYAILMPWVEGKSWFNYVTGKVVINRQESLQLARALVNAVCELEQRDLAHCDLSSSNFIFSPDFNHVELIDIEEMFGQGLAEPKEKPKGTGGYTPEWVKKDGVWEAGADRYSTGILVSEILGWQFEDIRAASAGDAFFAEGEFGNKSKRFRMMSDRLEQIHPELSRLFKTVWYAESVEECPRVADWKRVLDLIREPELQVVPDFLKFGKLDLSVKPALQPQASLVVKNIGGGVLTGRIQPNVPWLSVTPAEFSCVEGGESKHKVVLGSNAPAVKGQQSYTYQNGIVVHSNSRDHFLSGGSYAVVLPRFRVPIWAYALGASLVVLIIILMNVLGNHGPTAPAPIATPLITVTDMVAPTDTSIPITVSALNVAPVVSVANLDYSLDISKWNYYIPNSINLSETLPSSNWVEPPKQGRRRLYGNLKFGDQTIVDVILDEISDTDSDMMFTFNGDTNFIDKSVYKYSTNDKSGGVLVKFQVNYADGTNQPYAIYVYYFNGSSPAQLDYYRGSSRLGTIQLGGKTYTIALEDRNADGLYSDLENTGIAIDLNNDGQFTESEIFIANWPIQIGNTFYSVADISPAGNTIKFAEARFGQVTGIVSDSKSGQPLSGVTITLSPTGLSTTTDSSGKYSLQAPEGHYWQIAGLLDGYVPAYYSPPNGSLVAGAVLNIDIPMQPATGAKSGTLQLADGDSYNFLAGTRDKYSNGDFYCGFSNGTAQFWANNLHQQGVIDLGDLGNKTLDQIDPPTNGYYRFGVEAIVGHTYVSEAEEGENGHYVIFKVTQLQPGQYVEIEYYYR